MTASEERNSPRHAQSFEGLETPFLNEELFRSQAEDEWQGHLSPLVFESPFLGTFKHPGTQPDSAEMQNAEAFEDEFDLEEPGVIKDDDRVRVKETTPAVILRPELEAFSVQEDEADRGEELEDWEWESGEEEAEEGFSEPELRAGELLEAPLYTEGEAEYLTFESERTEREEDEEFDFLEENLFADEEASPDKEASFDLEEDEFYQEVLEAEQNPAIPASIAEFAISLGKDWSQRRNSDPTADAMTQWLLQDYQDTLTGAHHRWGDRFNSGIFTVNAIGRAWMVSRQENMKFQLLSSGFSVLKNFHPPKSRVSLVTSNLIEDSDKAPVAPIMVQFVKALRQHYPSFHASTYRGHGGGDFYDRGYSIDLFLQGRDSRGFYPVDDAVKFLRAMHETAAEVNAEWRVIYNDFSAAKAINQETGQYHVIFVGKASQNSQKKVNGIIWHGPEPLILHFHLDLVPRGSEASITTPSTSSTLPAPGQGYGKPAAELVRFAQRVLNAAEGERLNDDGDLGRLTRGALERFRKKYNLGTGGILDTRTEIVLVQRALEEIRQQSLFPKFGVLDTVTRDMLIEFKASHGLGTDPSVNAATRLALTDALASPLGALRPSATTSTSGAINWSSGLTPPTDSSKYRKFRLTTYYVTDQKDYPTGAVRVPIFDENGRKIAEGSPRFFAKLSLEGSALLTDGRLINVTGKTVPAQHSDYADVLVYHNQAYAKRNEERRQEGRGPVSTQYSGIVVKNGQVVKALAFYEVPRSQLGVGYGIRRSTKIPHTPFRTLAADIGYKKYASVDPKWKGKGGLVPSGTHVYIKEYDGLKLPDGTIHDGWFIVNDTGGAIFGAHFDVFVGTLAMYNQIKKLPVFGQVWFDGIEQRIPAGYTRGLKP